MFPKRRGSKGSAHHGRPIFEASPIPEHFIFHCGSSAGPWEFKETVSTEPAPPYISDHTLPEHFLPLTRWFQREVCGRLSVLDSKLDVLARKVAQPYAATVEEESPLPPSVAPLDECAPSLSPNHPAQQLSVSTTQSEGSSGSYSSARQDDKKSNHSPSLNSHEVQDTEESSGRARTEGRRPSVRLRSLVTREIGDILDNHSMVKSHRFHSSELLWHFLTDADSSRGAKVFKTLMNPFFLLTVAVTLSQHARQPLLSNGASAILEVVCETCFFVELIVRAAVCPSLHAFARDPFNAIDVMSAMPLAFRASVGFVLPDAEDEQVANWIFTRSLLLGVVPVIRLLKCLRRFESFHLLLTAFRVAFEAMPILLYTLFTIALGFSSLVYYVEPRSNIATLAEALWLVIVTMMTVGYGDVVPKTTAGQIIISVLIVVSALYLAIPIGIVGSAFDRVWADRGRLLLMKKTRDQLVQRGIQATDFAAIFELIGQNGTGELSFADFRRMMTQMRICMPTDLLFELFQSFDYDESGTIDHKEFLFGLFPAAYAQIYCDNRRESYEQQMGLVTSPRTADGILRPAMGASASRVF